MHHMEVGSYNTWRVEEKDNGITELHIRELGKTMLGPVKRDATSRETEGGLEYRLPSAGGRFSGSLAAILHENARLRLVY